MLFGIRAAQLERELGGHAVDYGTHAALGRRYMLKEAERALRPGDTAVLCLEYKLYSGDEINDTLVDYLMARDPDYLLHMRPWNVVRPFTASRPEGCWRAARTGCAHPLAARPATTSGRSTSMAMRRLTTAAEGDGADPRLRLWGQPLSWPMAARWTPPPSAT